MEFEETKLRGVFIVTQASKCDDRGFFLRTFCKKEFEKIGFTDDFVQMNQSYNRNAGTFRGLHYQARPFAETKLVRCVTGRVLDFIVDLQKESDTFLSYITVELSDENQKSVLIPNGFAHGFLTLEDHSMLLYCHTEFFNAEAERGVSYLDPSLGLDLPCRISHISERDRAFPLLGREFQGV